MSRSLTAWSRRVSLADCSHSRFALQLFGVQLSSLSFDDDDDGCLWELQVSEDWILY
jgi:hypothetical protein